MWWPDPAGPALARRDRAGELPSGIGFEDAVALVHQLRDGHRGLAELEDDLAECCRQLGEGAPGLLQEAAPEEEPSQQTGGHGLQLIDAAAAAILRRQFECGAERAERPVAEIAAMLEEKPMSTSPAVVFRNAEVGSKVQMKNGSMLLIEGKPSLLDHICLTPLGVWDKGGPPVGVLNPSLDSTEKKLDRILSLCEALA